MQSLEDLGMQTWETAKEGIYFEVIFFPLLMILCFMPVPLNKRGLFG